MSDRRRKILREFVVIILWSLLLAFYIETFGERGLYTALPMLLVNLLGTTLAMIFLPGILLTALAVGYHENFPYPIYAIGVLIEVALIWAICRRKHLTQAIRSH